MTASAEQRAEDHRRGSYSDGHPLAAERGRDFFCDQRRERAVHRNLVRGLIDETVRAAGELVEISEDVRIGGVRTRTIQIGTRASIQRYQFLQLVARDFRRLGAHEQLVELLPDRPAIGDEALDVHSSCLLFTSM